MGRGKARPGRGEMAAAETQGMDPLRVGFVGAGRMAEAIAQGFIRAGGAPREWGAWVPGSGSQRASDARQVCEGRVHLCAAHLPGGMHPAELLGEERGPQGSPPRGVLRVQRRRPGGRGPGRIADAAPADSASSAQQRGVCVGGVELVVPAGAMSHVGPQST